LQGPQLEVSPKPGMAARSIKRRIVSRRPISSVGMHSIGARNSNAAESAIAREKGMGAIVGWLLFMAVCGCLACVVVWLERMKRD
jgi:hypothetical protein